MATGWRTIMCALRTDTTIPMRRESTEIPARKPCSPWAIRRKARRACHCAVAIRMAKAHVYQRAKLLESSAGQVGTMRDITNSGTSVSTGGVYTHVQPRLDLQNTMVWLMISARPA
jgi:hypothetical protein